MKDILKKYFLFLYSIASPNWVNWYVPLLGSIFIRRCLIILIPLPLKKILEIAKLAKENNIGPVKSIAIYQCVMLTKLKTDDCARMDLSTIGAASECRDRCRVSQYAYALIHYTTCRCIPSELYKLAFQAASIYDCANHMCSDGTFCGGELTDSNKNADDCRYMNLQILVYSSFIANSFGMTPFLFSVEYTILFVMMASRCFEGWATNFHIPAIFKL